MRTLAPGRVSALLRAFETGENWHRQAISRLLPGFDDRALFGMPRSCTVRLIDYFDESAQRYPSRTAFVQPDGARLTYTEVEQQSRRIAAALHASGLAEARKVAVYSPNDARAFIAMLASFRSGRVWVPLNARNTVDDNAAFMNYTDVEGLFYHSSFENEVRPLPSGEGGCVTQAGNGRDPGRADRVLPFDAGRGEDAEERRDLARAAAQPRRQNPEAGNPRAALGRAVARRLAVLREGPVKEWLHAQLHLARHIIVAHHGAAVAQAACLSLYHEHPERVSGLPHQGVPCLPCRNRRSGAPMRGIELAQPSESRFQRSPHPPKRSRLFLDDLVIENVDGSAMKTNIAGHVMRSAIAEEDFCHLMRPRAVGHEDPEDDIQVRWVRNWSRGSSVCAAGSAEPGRIDLVETRRRHRGEDAVR